MTILRTVIEKLEPIDFMIIVALFLVTILIILGKDGIVLSMLSTLIGALARGLITKKD